MARANAARADVARADVALVERGLLDSRARAREAIEAGLVTRDGRLVRKASEPVPAGARLEARPAHPYVSRGALKLRAALNAFGVAPENRVALDLGASTGGFTELLLERGAARVHAVDVGHGQLHPRLAADPRVRSLEGTDARALDATLVPDRPGLLVADLSFIGLEKALPAALRVLAPAGDAILLVKPQFEAGRAAVGRGGVVRDAATREAAVARVAAWLARQGLRVVGRLESPIRGGDGNVEWLLHARWGPEAPAAAEAKAEPSAGAPGEAASLRPMTPSRRDDRA